MSDELLKSALSVSVPLYAMQLREQPIEDLLKLAQECAETIAHHDDNILFRSSKVGDAAKAFNALAKGIAVLAIVAPGGVEVFGQKWEFKRE